MGRSKIGNVISELSLEDQRELVLAFHQWANLQTKIAIEQGEFQANTSDIHKITSIPKETLEMLEFAVKSGDAEGSLKSGITEIIRSLPLMQKGSTGPTLNHFFKKNLRNDIFQLVYDAASLDPSKLVYDTSFPLIMKTRISAFRSLDRWIGSFEKGRYGLAKRFNYLVLELENAPFVGAGAIPVHYDLNRKLLTSPLKFISSDNQISFTSLCSGDRLCCTNRAP